MSHVPPDEFFLRHMLESAEKAQRFTAGMNRAAYDADEVVQLAIVRLLQIIGEAAWRVTKPMQDAHPAIPWQKISGFRHKVVHNYWSVDHDIVWRLVSAELQPLIDELRRMLPPSATP